MISKRLLALTKYISKKDIVLDVGCDHGYLSIYLKENKLCKEVYASEISKNALDIAKDNFKKYNVSIKSFLSDGFKDIDIKFNTAVIAGMGSSTIIKIINSDKCPNKLVISSNNDNYLLRSSLNKMGFAILNEEQILENNHFYIILNCIKGNQRLNNKELKYGISCNKEFYNYLLEKRKNIIKNVPFNRKVKLFIECLELKGLIKRK